MLPKHFIQFVFDSSIEIMSYIRSHLSSRSIPDARTHYKITRTITGSDGKVHTETIDAVDDEALKVSRSDGDIFSSVECCDIDDARYGSSS